VEAREFRDAFPRFEGLDATVLGVSPDSVKSHQKFKKKNNLPFTLVADPDHSIAERYGVWGEKTMFGRKYMGVLRTTFVIGPDGRIAKIFSGVKPEGHAEEVARFLAESKPQSKRELPAVSTCLCAYRTKSHHCFGRGWRSITPIGRRR